ncbi:cotranscriptional regulator ARB2A-like isoform X2 [Dysidea avara]|uniref:cotranscriptional regulator ARB2A-like isoform X2 n=1 Tax=Dysidea avara TaxID=196820 RepID=UPI00332EF2D6
MADDAANTEEQLTQEDTTETQAEQPSEKVEDTEKQDDTAASTSNEQNEGAASQNVEGQDQSADIDKDKMEGSTSSEAAKPSFPRTLEEFGYKFNDRGQLRQIENDEPFVFNVKESDQAYNQAHYEALGETITEHVYGLLESEGKLNKTVIPIDVQDNEATSFIFESDDARTADKLMVLIHGSGVVRAGQWARRLIINDCLDSGTQLPFIKRSLENNYGVMVLNTNRNTTTVDSKEESLTIRGSESAEEHTNYVWDNVITKCQAKKIDIVAHSYGGVAILDLLVQRFADVKSRVDKIAFTDSVHHVSPDHPDVMQWLSEHAINWVSSETPLDSLVTPAEGNIGKLSAGTKKHEETSWCSFDSIFKFFNGEEDYMQKVAKPGEPTTTTEEPVTTTTEEPVTTTTEEPVSKNEEPTASTEEPASKNEEPVTTTEEPVTATEEPTPKSQETTTTNEPDKDIEHRVETSGHHQSLKNTTDTTPPTEEMKSGCCVIV